MKTWNTAAAAAALLLSSAAMGDAPDRTAEGREIAQQFGKELRAELQAAMAEGGPLAAVRVCNEEAPRIAGDAARRAGAEVGRTSTRLRNPANRPDEHERAVLEDFEEAVAAGGAETPPERLETLPDGRVRYMRGIMVEAPCLVCHGQELAAPVAEVIDARYPEDEARGYALGDLRGAFTITWPAD